MRRFLFSLMIVDHFIGRDNERRGKVPLCRSRQNRLYHPLKQAHIDFCYGVSGIAARDMSSSGPKEGPLALIA
jgi:hypothetical protein